MKFKKEEIETIKKMIEWGHEILVARYIEDRIIPLYVYIEWAETAREYGQHEILQMLNNHQASAKLDKFNRPLKERRNKNGYKKETET